MCRNLPLLYLFFTEWSHSVLWTPYFSSQSNTLLGLWDRLILLQDLASSVRQSVLSLSLLSEVAVVPGGSATAASSVLPSAVEIWFEDLTCALVSLTGDGRN